MIEIRLFIELISTALHFKNMENRALFDLEGKAFELRKLIADKPTLLLLYNNQCLGCTGRAIPYAYELQQEFSDIQVIGVHSNFNGRQATKQEINEIFTASKAPLPIYNDDGRKLYDELNAEGTPHWVLYNEKGELINSIFGSQPNAQNRLWYALRELQETV